MQILVTGGAGFFGSFIVNELLKNGHDVVSFDLNRIKLRHPKLTSIQGDIRDAAKVALACEDVDTVHHNVAQVPIAKDRELFDSVNLGGAKILADQCRLAGVRSVVYTSSSAVFGVPRSNPQLDQELCVCYCYPSRRPLTCGCYSKYVWSAVADRNAASACGIGVPRSTASFVYFLRKTSFS